MQTLGRDGKEDRVQKCEECAELAAMHEVSLNTPRQSFVKAYLLDQLGLPEELQLETALEVIKDHGLAGVFIQRLVKKR